MNGFQMRVFFDLPLTGFAIGHRIIGIRGLNRIKQMRTNFLRYLVVLFFKTIGSG
ncbi:Uncharacterised protein [Vibrio cholerae]|nr:Uncharacterised protein [Vibrio cholerae]